MTIFKTFAALAVSLLLMVSAAVAEGQTHKLAIHVDENDPQVMNLALNNAANVRAHYESQGDTVMIEIVAYGPGLNMYTADSPVKDRLSAMALESDHVKFSACGNTIAGMEKKSGKKVSLVSEANVVSSGVVRLMELQGEGYAYIRP